MPLFALLDIRLWIGIALGITVGVSGGHAQGAAQGRLIVQAGHDRKAEQDLTAIIESNAVLVKQAGDASRAMRQAAARRESAERKTTEELQHALATTAGGIRAEVPGLAASAPKPGG